MGGHARVGWNPGADFRGLTAAQRADLMSITEGFVYQWSDIANGHVLTNPGQGNCAESTPTFDNCFFVANVGNGCTPRD